MSAPSAASWIAALCESVVHVMTTSLAAPVTVGEAAAPPRHPGAFVPISAGEASAQIGIVGDDRSLRALAAALLGVPPAEVASDDVADALGEIANMVAGGVKTRMLGQVAPVTLGLPVFVHGWIDAGERLTAIYRPLRIADITAHVALLLPRA
jgi:CheY-specific phosphatase CheX